MAKIKKEEGEMSKIELFKAQLVKEFGKGTIISAEEDETLGDVIPISSLTLKYALGIGGFSTNKIYELLGWESSGKSSLSYDLISNGHANFQDHWLLIDKENSFDKVYATTLGVDLNRLEICYPESLEDCYNVIERALDSKLFKGIIIDSLTSFQPKATLENPEGAMGKESRINSNRMRMVNAKIRESGCCVVFINQIREKIGVMFGNPETTSGGNALKFYAHVRIMIRRKEIKNGYNTMHFKIIKNKLAVPMKEAETTIIWGKGFDKESEIFYLAKEFEIVKKHGKKITYGEITFELSDKDAMQEFYDFLDQNLELKEEIINTVLNQLKNGAPVSKINVV